MAKSAMEAFEASLSDEQLGQFWSIINDPNCDNKLQHILTTRQYNLYLETKNQDNKMVGDLLETASVASWEKEDSVVSVTPSQAVSGTRSSATLDKAKTSRIYVTVFSPVVEHLSRDSYKLKKDIKAEYDVDIHPQLHKDNDQHTAVKFEGITKESLLEAQSLMWKNLKELQKRHLYLMDERIHAMWENGWEKVDRIIFMNRTNVYLMFVGANTILYGFQDSHLENAKELLEKYYKSGILPSVDKNIRVKHDTVKTKKTFSKPPTNLPRVMPSLPAPPKEVSFTMYINAPVVPLIIGNEALKKRIKDEFGVDMKCFSNAKDRNVAVVQLKASGYPVLLDVEYIIIEQVSLHQQFTFKLPDRESVTMWKSWDKGNKVRFFLETTVFVKEEFEVLHFSSFNQHQLTNAIDKLESYKISKNKPRQEKGPIGNDRSKSMTNLSKSMDTLSMTSGGSSRTRVANVPNMQRGAHDNFKFELELGDEGRVCGRLIGKGGANIKPMQDLYDTNASIKPDIGSITIRLSASTNDKIVDAAYHILRNVRQLQKCQTTFLLSPHHAWRNYTRMEKVEFQTRMQVTVEFYENNNSVLMLKSFLADKIPMAIAALDKEGPQTAGPFGNCSIY